jgi:outer membrane immunogenic protein
MNDGASGMATSQHHNGKLFMKRLLLGTAICTASVAGAFAADLPARSNANVPAYKAPEAMAVYNWTGFYIGGHIGGAFGGPDSLERHHGQFLGGLQFGFDRQFAGSWVIGSEVQLSGFAGNNGHGVLFPANTLVTDKTNLLGSFTARIGYSWGPALLYAKVGSAFRDNTDINASTGGVPIAVSTSNRHDLGITAGGGLEYMFAPNWSAKAEYQYYNFGDSTFTAGPAALIGSKFWNDEHTVKLGINYRFHSGG